MRFSYDTHTDTQYCVYMLYAVRTPTIKCETTNMYMYNSTLGNVVTILHKHRSAIKLYNTNKNVYIYICNSRGGGDATRSHTLNKIQNYIAWRVFVCAHHSQMRLCRVFQSHRISVYLYMLASTYLYHMCKLQIRRLCAGMDDILWCLHRATGHRSTCKHNYIDIYACILYLQLCMHCLIIYISIYCRLY